MPDVDLALLADAGAFVSREHQAHLDVIGVSDWRIDPGSATFAFTDGTGTDREVRAHLVGTASPKEGTWLWGWANVNDFPAAFVRQSERVHGLGERYGVHELTEAELPLDDALPGRLVNAVKAVTGMTAHWAAPTGNGGTRAWFLLDDPSLALPAPTVARAVGVVTGALAGGDAVDHRKALTAWAEQRHATLRPVDDDVEELTLTDGSLQVRFDAAGRIAGLGRRLRGAGPVRRPTAPPATAPVPVPVPVEIRADVPAAVPAPPRRGLLQRLLGR